MPILCDEKEQNVSLDKVDDYCASWYSHQLEAEHICCDPGCGGGMKPMPGRSSLEPEKDICFVCFQCPVCHKIYRYDCHNVTTSQDIANQYEEVWSGPIE